MLPMYGSKSLFIFNKPRKIHKNDSSVCGKLNDFINTLNSKYSSSKISTSDYNSLISAANGIKQSLGC